MMKTMLTLTAAASALALAACQPAVDEPVPAETPPETASEPKMDPAANDSVADVQPGEAAAPTTNETPQSATPAPDPQQRTVQ